VFNSFMLTADKRLIWPTRNDWWQLEFGVRIFIVNKL